MDDLRKDGKEMVSDAEETLRNLVGETNVEDNTDDARAGTNGATIANSRNRKP